MQKFFIIKTGFNAEDFIQITNKELDKAIYCQIAGITGIFDDGTINGKHIISIKEDWNRQMGWNRGYKLADSDYAAIRADSVCDSYKGLIAQAKQNVNYLISIGRTDLIGKVETFRDLDSGELNFRDPVANKQIV